MDPVSRVGTPPSALAPLQAEPPGPRRAASGFSALPDVPVRAAKGGQAQGHLAPRATLPGPAQSPLVDLPGDVIKAVVARLPTRDIANLSMLNTVLRSATAPVLAPIAQLVATAQSAKDRPPGERLNVLGSVYLATRQLPPEQMFQPLRALIEQGASLPHDKERFFLANGVMREIAQHGQSMPAGEVARLVTGLAGQLHQLPEWVAAADSGVQGQTEDLWARANAFFGYRSAAIGLPGEHRFVPLAALTGQIGVMSQEPREPGTMSLRSVAAQQILEAATDSGLPMDDSARLLESLVSRIKMLPGELEQRAMVLAVRGEIGKVALRPGQRKGLELQLDVIEHQFTRATRWLRTLGLR